MTTVNRKTFAELSHLGAIDMDRGGDPIAQLVKDLGITGADLKEIGDGNAVIRGELEFRELFDRLGKLDAKRGAAAKGIGRAEQLYSFDRRVLVERSVEPMLLPSAKLATPEPSTTRLYSAVVADRSVPEAKSFKRLETRADFDGASSEAQTRRAAQVLDRIGASSDVPPEVVDATAAAIDVSATVEGRSEARDTMVAWAKDEASRLDAMRREVGARQADLEHLIGYADGSGRSRAGYYDRVIAEARGFIALQQPAAKEGSAKAKAAIERSEKIIRWSEREESEARAIFRSFAARSVDDAGWIDDASDALRASADLVIDNGRVFEEHRAAVDALVKDIEGEGLPDLGDPNAWIGRFEDLQGRLAETADLHQRLLDRAERDPMFAEWLDSSGLLQNLEQQEHGLTQALAETNELLRARKAEEIAGRTGHTLGLRDDSIALAQEAVGGLLEKDDRGLEELERSLVSQHKVVKEELADLRATKKKLEGTVDRLEKKTNKTAAELFDMKTARLELQGVVPNTKKKAISLADEIATLEQTAKLLRLTYEEVDGRRAYLADVTSAIGERYDLEIKGDGSNASAIDGIRQLQKLVPVDGLEDDGKVLTLKTGKHTFRVGPDSSYGNVRKLVDAYASLQDQQQAHVYGVVRAVLEKTLSEKDLESLGFTKDAVDALPKAIAFANHLTGRADGTESTKTLAAWALGRTEDLTGTTDVDLKERAGAALAKHAGAMGAFVNVERRELLAILQDPRRLDEVLSPAEAKEVLDFVRALVTSEDLEKKLGVKDGRARLETLEAFAEASELLTAYAEAQQAKRADKLTRNVDVQADGPTATFFPRAMEIVRSLDPETNDWKGDANPLFEAVKDLDQGERAYFVALFDAYYSNKYGDDYLSKIVKGSSAGHALTYIGLIRGETAKERGADFERHFLREGRAGQWIHSQGVGVTMLEKGDSRSGYDLPKNMQNAADERVRKMMTIEDARQALLTGRADLSGEELGIANEKIAKLETELVQLAGELELLTSALLDGYNGEVGEHNASNARLRGIIKKVAVAAGATVAAYLTAGALAPEAGILWAGVGATIVGTGVGMGVAFSYDVGEQLAENGSVDLGRAGKSALDAAPDAFAAALPTGFLTAAVAVRSAALIHTLNSARTVSVLGLTVKPAELAMKARLAGTVAVYSTATSYVGNLATAAYYKAKGQDDLAAEIFDNAPRDALFAGASAVVLMPLSRFSGLTGMAVDGAGNAAQQIAYNEISGRAWNDGLEEAVITGAVMSKIFETHRNIKAAGQLDKAGAVGAEVRLKKDATLAWKIESINANRGFVTISSGGVKQRVHASIVLEAGIKMPDAPRKKDPARSKGPVLDTGEAAKFFEAGSKFELESFTTNGITYRDLTVDAGGTIHGKKPKSSKREPLENLDGTPMTALDLVEASPSSLLPAGLEVIDLATGHRLKVEDVRGWDDPRLLVSAHDASGRVVGYAEMRPSELVARNVSGADGRAIFDAKSVEAAKARQGELTSFTSDPPPVGTDVGPPLNGIATEPRILETDLEQRVQKLVGATVRSELGARADTSAAATSNADGSVTVSVKVKAKGDAGSLAELSMTIDPKTKTVRIGDPKIDAVLEGKGVAEKISAAQADFLSRHFAGWGVSTKVPKKGAAPASMKQHFEGVTVSKSGVAIGRIPALDARVEKVAPKNGFDRADVVSIDDGKVTLERNGQRETVAVADVLRDHAALAIGLDVKIDQTRYRIAGVDGNGMFDLVSLGGTKRRTATADEIYLGAPRAMEALLSLPAVRVRETTMRNGEAVSADVHGFKLVGVDEANGLAYLRNADGAVESRPLEQISYEHSGVALSSLNAAQHARHAARLEGLSDTELVDWAHLRAEAADLSPEHAALADRTFALGYSTAEIDSLMASIRNVPQAELGALFSVKGMTQHYRSSCVAAACLYGIGTTDPMLGKLFNDHPDVGAWWQRNIVEGQGGSVHKRTDGDYVHSGTKTDDTPGTSTTPVRVEDGRDIYAAKELDPIDMPRALNDRAFFSTPKDVLVTLDGTPPESVRITSDGRGGIAIESPPGAKPAKVKLPLFDRVKVGDQWVLGLRQGKAVKAIVELGLPPGLEPPGRDRGMTHVRDKELMNLIEMSTGQQYVMRDAKSLTPDRLKDAVDWSLGEGHPVALAIEWTDPKTGTPLGTSHQLWIAEKRTLKGRDEYLVYDPHFDAPKWLKADQLSSYTALEGGVGKPLHVLVPDYIPLPGGGVIAGGVRVSGPPEVPPGSLIRDKTKDIVIEARRIIQTETANAKAGRKVDEAARHEALLAMALATDRGDGYAARLTEFRKKYVGADRNTTAEVDVQTDSALFEATTGNGKDKMEQYDERVRQGKVGNQGQLPVVLVGTKTLDPVYAKAMDARGVLVVDNIADAVKVNRLYKQEPDVLHRLWGLEAFDRQKAVKELLAARTAGERAHVAAKYGLDRGEIEVANRTGDELAKDASWKNNLSADQVQVVEQALSVLPSREGSRVVIVRYDDGSIALVARRRVKGGELWRDERMVFDAQGNRLDQR